MIDDAEGISVSYNSTVTSSRHRKNEYRHTTTLSEVIIDTYDQDNCYQPPRRSQQRQQQQHLQSSSSSSPVRQQQPLHLRAVAVVVDDSRDDCVCIFEHEQQQEQEQEQRTVVIETNAGTDEQEAIELIVQHSYQVHRSNNNNNYYDDDQIYCRRIINYHHPELVNNGNNRIRRITQGEEVEVEEDGPVYSLSSSSPLLIHSLPSPPPAPPPIRPPFRSFGPPPPPPPPPIFHSLYPPPPPPPLSFRSPGSKGSNKRRNQEHNNQTNNNHDRPNHTALSIGQQQQQENLYPNKLHSSNNKKKTIMTTLAAVPVQMAVPSEQLVEEELAIREQQPEQKEEPSIDRDHNKNEDEEGQEALWVDSMDQDDNIDKNMEDDIQRLASPQVVETVKRRSFFLSSNNKSTRSQRNNNKGSKKNVVVTSALDTAATPMKPIPKDISNHIVLLPTLTTTTTNTTATGNSSSSKEVDQQQQQQRSSSTAGGVSGIGFMHRSFAGHQEAMANLVDTASSSGSSGSCAGTAADPADVDELVEDNPPSSPSNDSDDKMKQAAQKAFTARRLLDHALSGDTPTKQSTANMEHLIPPHLLINKPSSKIPQDKDQSSLLLAQAAFVYATEARKIVDEYLINNPTNASSDVVKNTNSKQKKQKQQQQKQQQQYNDVAMKGQNEVSKAQKQQSKQKNNKTTVNEDHAGRARHYLEILLNGVDDTVQKHVLLLGSENNNTSNLVANLEFLNNTGAGMAMMGVAGTAAAGAVIGDIDTKRSLDMSTLGFDNTFELPSNKNETSSPSDLNRLAWNVNNGIPNDNNNNDNEIPAPQNVVHSSIGRQQSQKNGDGIVIPYAMSMSSLNEILDGPFVGTTTNGDVVTFPSTTNVPVMAAAAAAVVAGAAVAENKNMNLKSIGKDNTTSIDKKIPKQKKAGLFGSVFRGKNKGKSVVAAAVDEKKGAVDNAQVASSVILQGTDMLSEYDKVREQEDDEASMVEEKLQQKIQDAMNQNQFPVKSVDGIQYLDSEQRDTDREFMKKKVDCQLDDEAKRSSSSFRGERHPQFISAPKGDPAILTQKSWDSIHDDREDMVAAELAATGLAVLAAAGAMNGQEDERTKKMMMLKDMKNEEDDDDAPTVASSTANTETIADDDDSQGSKSIPDKAMHNIDRYTVVSPEDLDLKQTKRDIKNQNRCDRYTSILIDPCSLCESFWNTCEPQTLQLALSDSCSTGINDDADMTYSPTHDESYLDDEQTNMTSLLHQPDEQQQPINKLASSNPESGVDADVRNSMIVKDLPIDDDNAVHDKYAIPAEGGQLNGNVNDKKLENTKTNNVQEKSDVAKKTGKKSIRNLFQKKGDNSRQEITIVPDISPRVTTDMTSPAIAGTVPLKDAPTKRGLSRLFSSGKSSNNKKGKDRMMTSQTKLNDNNIVPLVNNEQQQTQMVDRDIQKIKDNGVLGEDQQQSIGYTDKGTQEHNNVNAPVEI